jgi:hypothetical protein
VKELTTCEFGGYDDVVAFTLSKEREVGIVKCYEAQTTGVEVGRTNVWWW